MNSANQTASETALLFTTTFLKAWTLQVKRVNEFLDCISDEDLLKEVAPGKNTGIYLLGHLTAVNDGILPLLGFCDKLYPELEKVFISSPDKSGLSFPPIDELRNYWNDVNEKLIQHFKTMTPEQWLTKHEAVSAEDFVKEPHRNKLNVVIVRTTHMSYHLGQFILLTGKGEL